MVRFLLSAWLAALALLIHAPASAEEKILHFFSDVSVQRDGSLVVEETIRVVSEDVEIRRGIFRDFPTKYERDGRLVRVGLEVLAALRNGKPEPWKIDSIDNGERIMIGDPEVFLEPGEHEYKIRYRTTRQLGFFADYDELYWNATGTAWRFPIEVAEARIKLPAPVRFGNRAVYTGPQGSTERNAQVVDEQNGQIRFRTTAPLAPNEGLTIAVAWPKNIVDPPEPRSAASLWLQRWAPRAAGLLGLFGILAYYIIAWRKVGRDPDEGPVVPLFGPPDDLSAPELRYLAEMGGFDNRCFAAALVDLGVRGRIRLVEGEKAWFASPQTTIEKTGGTEALPPGHAALMNALFAQGDAVLMDDANHKIFSNAKDALQKELQKKFDGKLFLRNQLWAAAGLVFLGVSALFVAIVTILTDPELPDRQEGLAASLFAVGLILVAYLLYRWARRSEVLRKLLGAALALVAGCAALYFVLRVFEISVGNEAFLPFLLPLLSLPLIISAFWWMAAPTRHGRTVMDRIAGFRQYLSVTEEDRLDTLHPPEKTPELFERFLPHAIALDVENAWAKRFTQVLAAAAASGRSQSMGWYSGHSDPWHDADGFADQVGSSLASSVSSASTAPGSSSGSSGGGSSGGGGGGGGGGGW